MHQLLTRMSCNSVLKRFFLPAVFLLILPSFFFPRTFKERPENRLKPLNLGDVRFDLGQQNWLTSTREMLSTIRDWQRREGINKIVGLIFYGRRDQASILDCYLKRNLVKNGGVLEEVIWLQRTKNLADLAFLDRLVGSEPDYSKLQVDLSEGGYSSSYDSIKDDVLYVKIDTDIVFIEDTSILSMIHTRATRSDYYVVGANVVNQPLSSWVHWNLGAIKPYLPEQDISHSYHQVRSQDPVSWRASLLPSWSGPQDLDLRDWTPPKNRKHRWLPLAHRKDHVLDSTPIVYTTYEAFSPAGFGKWTVGAQQHYSLFENLEKSEMWRYRFHTWDYRDLRMGIQFIVMTGKDINIAKPIKGNDEAHFTVTMTKKLGRTAVADGSGVVAHYSFHAQIEGMNTTDILDRYRLYAEEMICGGKMLWKSEADDFY